MKISNTGVELIAKWEGFRNKAYQDIVGVWTIGYGHTRNVRNGDTITKENAKKLLATEIERHTVKIFDYVKVPLTQGQYDALASFHYNLGANILKGTDLLNEINKQNWINASAEMLRFNKAGGRIVQGLVNRRKEEAQLFLDSSPTSKKTLPAKAPAKSTNKTHKVKSGDTLSKIAKNNNTTIAKLMELNSFIKDKDVIEIGQVIKLPSTTTTSKKYVEVKKNDTLSGIAFKNGLTLNALLELNPSKKKDPDKIYLKEKIRIE